MFKPKIQTQLESTLSKIDNSKKLEETDKVLYRDLIQTCADNTNGITQEEKLQNTTEILFRLVQLIILDKVSKDKNRVWDVIINCKWQLVLIIGIISILLIFQPQLATIIAKLII